jgi:hypothetical protein
MSVWQRTSRQRRRADHGTIPSCVHAWVRREGHPRVFGTVVDTQFNDHQERYAVRWEDQDCRLCQGEVVWVSRGYLNVVRGK